MRIVVDSSGGTRWLRGDEWSQQFQDEHSARWFRDNGDLTWTPASSNGWDRTSQAVTASPDVPPDAKPARTRRGAEVKRRDIEAPARVIVALAKRLNARLDVEGAAADAYREFFDGFEMAEADLRRAL